MQVSERKCLSPRAEERTYLSFFFLPPQLSVLDLSGTFSNDRIVIPFFIVPHVKHGCNEIEVF